jgi:plastocyanin
VIMTRCRGLLVFLAALGAVFASPNAALAQTNRLVADVGQNDAFIITLRTASGGSVDNIPAGTYEVEVHDHSTMHNFRLSGPGGVNQATTEAFVGTVMWTVTLQDGRYTFQCDPHPTQMRGSFTVGIPTPPPPPPPPPPTATTLIATVGPGATISLRTRAGRRVRQVRRGRYRIVVRDRSRMHNFHLRGPGLNKRTTVPFRGMRTWTVTLRRGIYRFICDPHARRMRGSFRVT